MILTSGVSIRLSDEMPEQQQLKWEVLRNAVFDRRPRLPAFSVLLSSASGLHCRRPIQLPAHAHVRAPLPSPRPCVGARLHFRSLRSSPAASSGRSADPSASRARCSRKSIVQTWHQATRSSTRYASLRLGPLAGESKRMALRNAARVVIN